jgi:hypothetical protein
MAVGLDRKEAARRVAKTLCFAGVKLEGNTRQAKGLTGSTVAGRRNEIHAKMKAAPSPDDDMDVETYRLYLHKMSTQEGWPPKPGELDEQQRERFRVGVLNGLSWFMTHGAS